jgi:hypothetical protein
MLAARDAVSFSSSLLQQLEMRLAVYICISHKILNPDKRLKLVRAIALKSLPMSEISQHQLHLH